MWAPYFVEQISNERDMADQNWLAFVFNRLSLVNGGEWGG